jgi:hypothetical protein
VCVYLFGQRESRDSLLYYLLLCACACPICSRGKKNTPGREMGRKRMNELLLLAPLYLEVNNLRIFEPFFLLLSAPGSCSTRGKIKKERKTLQIFPFFLGTGEWHSIERGAGWLDCQLPSSFALLVYTDRYMASTTLYNSSLLLYVVWLFFLSLV